MPRAALLSIHARVAGAGPTVWEHRSLVQIWGPRFSAYVVAAKDLPVFSLGRLPADVRGHARAQSAALRLHDFLDGRRMPFSEAGHAMGVIPNSLRYGAPTGRILIRWAGAQEPLVWTGPAPAMEAKLARLELARRYLHIFGPTTAASFRDWARIRPAEARAAFEALRSELTPVRRRLAMPGFSPTTRLRFEQSPALPRRRGSCPAEILTSCCGKQIENSSCRTRRRELRSGPRACGPARCW